MLILHEDLGPVLSLRGNSSCSVSLIDFSGLLKPLMVTSPLTDFRPEMDLLLIKARTLIGVSHLIQPWGLRDPSLTTGLSILCSLRQGHLRSLLLERWS